MPPRDVESRPADIVVERLSGGTLRDISIKLHHGEVLGLTGLIGTGFDEVLALLFGARPAAGGNLTIGAQVYAVDRLTPAAAIKAGVAFLPADRLGESGVGGLSVTDNGTLTILDEFVRGGLLDRSAMAAQTRAMGEAYEVRPNVPSLTLDSLSGGNQQKVLLYKWLQKKPVLLLLDEPTRRGRRWRPAKASYGDRGSGQSRHLGDRRLDRLRTARTDLRSRAHLARGRLSANCTGRRSQRTGSRSVATAA